MVRDRRGSARRTGRAPGRAHSWAPGRPSGTPGRSLPAGEPRGGPGSGARAVRLPQRAPAHRGGQRLAQRAPAGVPAGSQGAWASRRPHADCQRYCAICAVVCRWNVVADLPPCLSSDASCDPIMSRLAGFVPRMPRQAITLGDLRVMLSVGPIGHSAIGVGDSICFHSSDIARLLGLGSAETTTRHISASK